MSTRALSVIILGASGDLAKKKTFPALYSLYLYGQLPVKTRIFAYSRSVITHEKLFDVLYPKLKDLTFHILNENMQTFEQNVSPLPDECMACPPSPLAEVSEPLYATDDNGVHPRIRSFMSMISFHQCASYDDGPSAAALEKEIRAFDEMCAVRQMIIYLALPPNQFLPAIRAFRQNCWRDAASGCKESVDAAELLHDDLPSAPPCIQPVGNRTRTKTLHCEIPEPTNCHGSWTHIVVEKPFGHDYDSALAMSQELSQCVTEDEIFRIDHYLGKEMVLNLFVLRFANSFLAPLWNRHYIKSVRVTFKESIGTFGRGGYFDQFGIIRDVVQNHLLQIVSLIAMEPPVSLNDEHIRDEKVKLLRAIQPPTVEYTVLGQYGRGCGKTTHCSNATSGPSTENSTNDLNRILTTTSSAAEMANASAAACAPTENSEEYTPGYHDDPTVPAGSKCPTFVTTVLWINNERWSGVPFILKAGKALEQTLAEIRIQFHSPQNHLFTDKVLPRNELVFRIQPDDAVYMKILSKKPGLNSADGDIVETELDLSVLDRHGVTRVNDAYERLLLDVINSDKKNFVRTDELLEAWRIFDPLIKLIESKGVKPIPYPAGSHGPAEHYDLIKCVGYSRFDGYVWHRSVSR